MDPIDRKILALLQSNAGLSIADIATKVGLSQTPCWKRIQKMEQAGVIKARVALLDAKRLNLGLTVFVIIRTNQHDDVWLQKFARAVKEMNEITAIWRMAGDIDYLLRVVVKDMEAYDAFYRRLIKRVSLSDVSSTFVMEEIKYTTARLRAPLPSTSWRIRDLIPANRRTAGNRGHAYLSEAASRRPALENAPIVFSKGQFLCNRLNTAPARLQPHLSFRLSPRRRLRSQALVCMAA